MHRIGERQVHRQVVGAGIGLVGGEHHERLVGPLLEFELGRSRPQAADIAREGVLQKVLPGAVEALLLGDFGAGHEGVPREAARPPGGVIEQAKFLASPVTGPSDEDIALDSDLRAVALMNLGIIEAWSLALPTRNATCGKTSARRIGRPYLEVACLAQLGFASKIRPFATTRRRCREAIALADRHGWGADPIVAPALVTLAANLAWTGES